MSNENYAIKVENVSKSFVINHNHTDNFREYFWNIFRKKDKSKSVFHALKNISFTIEKGDFVGIIGKNGSGKSTLLKIISGIYQPNTGGVKVQGKIIPFLELGVGFNPNLSARENVYLNGIILGMTRKEVESKYDEIISFAEIENFQDMPLKTFSSGMQVRLAFSIAIQAKGDIYIMDEVLAVGDASFQEKCLLHLNKMMKENKTIIFVSHDINSIRKFCKKVVYINDSEIKFEGNTLEGTNLYYNDLRYASTKRQSISPRESSANTWKITNVEFLDTNGVKKESFDTGDDMIVRIETEAEEPVEHPVIGTGIFSDDGRYITGPNTRTSHVKIEKIEGKHTIDLMIKRLPLLGGKHLFKVRLFDYMDTVTYDISDQEYFFNVSYNEENQTGLVKFEIEWKEKTKNGTGQ